MECVEHILTSINQMSTPDSVCSAVMLKTLKMLIDTSSLLHMSAKTCVRHEFSTATHSLHQYTVGALVIM